MTVKRPVRTVYLKLYKGGKVVHTAMEISVNPVGVALGVRQ